MAEQSKGFHYGWVVVIATCLIMFMPCCFTFNAASVFYTDVANALTGGEIAPVSLYISIVYITMFFSLLVLGKQFEIRDSRIILVMSVACIAIAFLIMAFAPVIQLFYVAGVLLGIGNAVVLYLLVPVMFGRWFSKNVGTLIGVGMAMTGLGGMLWSPIATSIIQSSGYQTAYLMYAGLSAIIGIPCALLIRSRPSEKGLEPMWYNAEEAAAAAEAAKGATVEGVTVQAARKAPLALILIALYAGLVNFGLTMNYHLPAYIRSLTDVFPGDGAAAIGATLASVTMFGSLIGKLILGWTNDRSVPGSVIFGLASGIIGLLCVLFGPNISPMLVYVGGALFGVFFASATTTTPQITRKVFGNLDYSQIYSYVTAVCAFLAAFGATLWGVIYDRTGSYTGTFFVDIAIMAVCFVLAFAGMAVGKNLPRETKSASQS